MKQKHQLAFNEMLGVLRTTETNIRSLGPAGALGEVWWPYQIWLRVVQDAIKQAERYER